MIILQQVYVCLRHFLQMKYLEKKTENEKQRQPITFLAMLVKTKTFFSEVLFYFFTKMLQVIEILPKEVFARESNVDIKIICY